MVLITIHAFIAMTWRTNSSFSRDEPKKEMSSVLVLKLCENVAALITLDQSSRVLICLPKTTATSRKPRFTLANFGDRFSKLLLGDRASSALQVVKANK